MGPRSQCTIPCHKVIGPLVREKKFFVFEGFYHIWAWWPSWSCDPDAANKLSFPHPTEAPHEFWLRLAQWFWRRSLKMVDVQRTDNRAWLYYKLTNEPKGWGDLKIIRSAIWCNKVVRTHPNINIKVSAYDMTNLQDHATPQHMQVWAIYSLNEGWI